MSLNKLGRNSLQAELLEQNSYVIEGENGKMSWFVSRLCTVIIPEIRVNLQKTSTSRGSKQVPSEYRSHMRFVWRELCGAGV